MDINNVKVGDEFFKIGRERDYAFYIRKIIITNIIDKGNQGKRWLFFYYQYEDKATSYFTEENFDLFFTKEEALKECELYFSNANNY